MRLLQQSFINFACDMSGLEGKVVIVTGASSGIGAGAAEHFAALKERTIKLH